MKAAQKNNQHGHFLKHVLDVITEKFEFNPLKQTISDHFEKFVAWEASDRDYTFQVLVTYRRMGIENGMDTVVHIDNNLKIAQQHMIDVISAPVAKH